MTDLHLCALCARAMGYHDLGGDKERYDPLHDDAQCMALIKRFRLDIETDHDGATWVVFYVTEDNLRSAPIFNADLNRAVCECVATMEPAK